LRGLPLLPNLTILSIQSNRITAFENLSPSTLPNLEELYISHNLLKSLSGIEDCKKLRVLDISSNAISKLEGLENLEELEEFWASNCQFDDFADVERQLRSKTKLETVYFEGTPLQKRQPALYRNKVRLALPQIKQIDASKYFLFILY
jgi:protein phosphatase 1 regulatory subunit 7